MDLHTNQPIIVGLPNRALSTTEEGQRIVYFEASRDGVVDREGEMVAVDALWASRELMLEQGDLDVAHWSHLVNPLTGRPQPEYRIGHPTDVKRSANKRSVFVKGEIYRSLDTPPPGSSAAWSERFWHSLTGQTPPAKWFPSVYGTIKRVEMAKVGGREVRRIVECEWYSVGFALRAQHPELPAVSLTPQGSFAKADNGLFMPTTKDVKRTCAGSGAVHMSWGTFAKAVSEVGVPVTDSAARTGVQALTPESLERTTRRAGQPKLTYPQAKKAVMRCIRSGTVEVNMRDLTRAFAAVGLGKQEARQLFDELARRAQA